MIYTHVSITASHFNDIPHAFTSDTSSFMLAYQIASPILNRPFLLMPIYMSNNAVADDWMKVKCAVDTATTALTDALDIPFLLIGDMNARHPSWDPTCDPDYNNTSTNGRHLSSIIAREADWHLLNNELPAYTNPLQQIPSIHNHHH